MLEQKFLVKDRPQIPREIYSTISGTYFSTQFSIYMSNSGLMISVPWTLKVEGDTFMQTF
jgi:hypothetical protein